MVDINTVLNIAKMAGDEILTIYNNPNSDFGIEKKADNSPVTLADIAADRLIQKELTKYYPEIPIISEEGPNIPFEKRKNWVTFFLVDPLDGTKEFISKNGEFTVNIALIHEGTPILGVIYQPTTNTSFYGSSTGAFKKNANSTIKLPFIKNTNLKVAVRSKSHPAPEEQKILDQYNIQKDIAIGSSLKFCLVASGEASLYYRHNPTMEWDVAAGHAVLLAAGGQMYIGDTTEKVFEYNKESLLNGSFLCLRG